MYDVIKKIVFYVYFTKQVGPMFLYVCSVTHPRRRENMLRTSEAHSPKGSCTRFLFSPHFDILSDLLLRRSATWIVKDVA